MPRSGPGSQCSPLEVGITRVQTHHCRCHGRGLCRNGSSLLGVLEAFGAAGRAGKRLVVKADHLDVGAAERRGQREEASWNKALFSSFSLTLLAQLTAGLLSPFQSIPLTQTCCRGHPAVSFWSPYRPRQDLSGEGVLYLSTPQTPLSPFRPTSHCILPLLSKKRNKTLLELERALNSNISQEESLMKHNCLSWRIW